MEKRQDGILDDLSLLINCDEPIVVSETLDEDQDDQRSIMKELIKLMKIQLIKGDGLFSPVSSKISAIKGKRFPAQARNNNRTASCIAL